MPELPEVETIARGLRAEIVGREICGAMLRWSRTLATPSEQEFVDTVVGLRIVEISRRGKFLRLVLEPAGSPPPAPPKFAELAWKERSGPLELLIHLRMSGDLRLEPAEYAPGLHDRLILSLSGGVLLVFNDTRKFGRVWLTGRPEQVTGTLGPEPLSDEFTPGWLFEALHRRHRQLKPLLLDQTFLAGLGNIYTDEALHMARLHPLRPSDSLSEEETARLWNSIRETLRIGVENNGASIDWVYRGGGYQHHFRVYGRTGQPCPVCGTQIERILVGQRGTHFCPNCQPGGTTPAAQSREGQR